MRPLTAPALALAAAVVLLSGCSSDDPVATDAPAASEATAEETPAAGEPGAEEPAEETPPAEEPPAEEPPAEEPPAEEPPAEEPPAEEPPTEEPPAEEPPADGPEAGEPAALDSPSALAEALGCSDSFTDTPMEESGITGAGTCTVAREEVRLVTFANEQGQQEYAEIAAAFESGYVEGDGWLVEVQTPEAETAVRAALE